MREYETFLRARGEAVSNMEPPMNLAQVRYVDRAPLEDECETFRLALEKAGGGFAQPFMTAPSPGIVVSAMQSSHYADRKAYLADVADALRVEYEEVLARGWLLQIDAPDLAMERHFLFADEPLGVFQDWVELVVETLNGALADVPRDRVRLHVCWGNYEGPHDMDVELRDVLPILLKADVGGLVLPFANPRHQHEVEELGRSPLAPDQYLVAGVIDTTTNYVEHPETVAERLERAARVVGDPARIQAGTDCGFDTSAGMGRVPEDVVWAKLRSMAEGAHIAGGRLGVG